MSAQTPAIQLHQLQFAYTKKSTSPLIHIPDWQVAQGETVFLYGPSGSGKSTLLNLLSGVLTPQTGEILLNATAIQSLTARQRDAFRARHVGLVFQQFNLIPYLTVRENILLASQIAGTSRALVETRLSHFFENLQLDLQLADRPAAQLSVGQQQRVAIVRALINQPEIVIVDEPTSALDQAARSGFIRLMLEQIQAAQSTLLFVSHDHTLADYFNRQVNFLELNLAGEIAHVA